MTFFHAHYIIIYISYKIINLHLNTERESTMRFVHLSDLHIGKSIVKDDSMPEDQSYILDRIIDIIKEEQPDAVLIAGDIYDTSVPSA